MIRFGLAGLVALITPAIAWYLPGLFVLGRRMQFGIAFWIAFICVWIALWVFGELTAALALRKHRGPAQL